MAEKTNKRKVVKAATAVGMAAVLLMGGTFAWQSISQEATNIVTAAVNPGGRLHDDFDGSNDKNIYVENFGTQKIFARIKLSEYLEIGQNAGNFAEGTNRTDVVQHLGTDVNDKSTYKTYLYGEENLSDEYWTKDWDGSTKYIPTFNKDQDSLEADLNGTYGNTTDVDGDGTAEPYEDFVDYNAADATGSKEDTAWYDADADDSVNTHDEASVTAGNVTIQTETHTLTDSLGSTVISMADWDGTPGAYWVYDTDGWAYWAQAIEPGTATGLLLDSITDLGLIDEDYYYAIHVTGQFITAGDLGQDDNTGFYADGEAPTAEALTLLDTIGVKVNGEIDDSTTEYSINVASSSIEGNTMPVLDSASTYTLTFNTTLDGVSVENVTYSTTAENITIDEDGVIKAADNVTMTSVLEAYTVTASVGDEVIGETTVYMYNSQKHGIKYDDGADYSGVVSSSTSDNVYLVLDNGTAAYLPTVKRCIYKFGESVEDVYVCEASKEPAFYYPQYIDEIYNEGVISNVKCEH